MQKSVRFMASVLFLGAYLLSACTGAVPQSSDPVKAQKVDAHEVVFTGTIEEIDGDQWTISGQKVTVDLSTTLDPNIKVGDEVKVEGNVSQDGVVVAEKIESSTDDDANSNDDDGNSNDDDANSNDDDGNSNDDDANSNDDDGNSNDDDANGNDDDSNSNDGDDSNGDDDDGNSNDDDDSNGDEIGRAHV